jgi:CRISPR-associated protein (TIGR03986 family)
MANYSQNRAKASAPPASLHFPEKFENPYNFVPAPPRVTGHPTLGDAQPAGHHRYQAPLWSGRISVQLTTVTPLLIPGQPQVAENGHQTFGIRSDEAGAPSLPPTSIKGALRAAYEAVTNSRFGVCSKRHDSRLAFRLAAASALELIPVRVLRSAPDNNGKRTLLAVEHEAHSLTFYSTTSNDRRRGAEDAAERYGNLQEGDPIPLHADCVQLNPRSGELLWVEESQGLLSGWRRGYAVVNGPNIKNKSKERLFLEIARPRKFGITKVVASQWQELIDDYRRLHQRDLEKRRRNGNDGADYLGDKPGETAWSRHILDAESSKLKHGLLCYAKVTDEHLVALYPVLISRELFTVAPSQLLDDSLKPAAQLSQLSPADRVFGWAQQAGQYKGQLRVAHVRCSLGSAAIERVGGEQGVALAILAAPKTEQARFYGAPNRQGTPYPRGTKKTAMYRHDHGQRGRKAYPHQQQAGLPDYWRVGEAQPVALTERLGQRRVYREWRFPGNSATARSDQNRSITAWVKPGCTFTFDLQVTNLSTVELGALLWLLTLGDDEYLRMGGGKPLGFGSVRLQVAAVDLCDGEALRAGYASFGESPLSGSRLVSFDDLLPLVEAYKETLPAAVGTPEECFENLRIIKAFRNAARGGTLPVHYPRTQLAPSSEGENFKWFVANEADTTTRQELYSLPDLAAAERGLWMLRESR